MQSRQQRLLVFSFPEPLSIAPSPPPGGKIVREDSENSKPPAGLLDQNNAAGGFKHEQSKLSACIAMSPRGCVIQIRLVLSRIYTSV
jgi:hypothetical protein